MQLGCDTNYSGGCVLLQNNKIIDIIMYPDKVNNEELNKLIKYRKLKDVEFFSKRYNKKFRGYSDSLDKQVFSEMKDLKFKTDRDYKLLNDFFLKHKNNIEKVIIEKPLLQSSNNSSIEAIAGGLISLDIYRFICYINDIEVKIISESEWRKYYDYKPCPDSFFEQFKDTKKTRNEITREWRKLESIRLAEKHISNIKDWYKIGKSKKINDNICEASLIGYINI